MFQNVWLNTCSISFHDILPLVLKSWEDIASICAECTVYDVDVLKGKTDATTRPKEKSATSEVTEDINQTHGRLAQRGLPSGMIWRK